MANDQENRLDVNEFDNAPGAGDITGVGDNIDFGESLPANDNEKSSIITDDEGDEAAEDAQEDVV